MKEIAAIAVLVILVPVSLYVWFSGPCELYRFSAAGEIPARCLMEGGA